MGGARALELAPPPPRAGRRVAQVGVEVGVEVRVRRGRGEAGRQSDEGEAWGAAVSKT